MYYNNYLAHYGVLGMRWGVHRAAKMSKSFDKLEKKAVKYDQKAARAYRSSERAHVRYDLDGYNRSATRSANYELKSIKNAKKAEQATDPFTKVMYEAKSGHQAYKSAQMKLRANRISKTTGYGITAMRLSVRSDRAALSAARARRKIAMNKKYIAMMDRKVASLSKEELAGAYSFVNDMKKD